MIRPAHAVARPLTSGIFSLLVLFVVSSSVHAKTLAVSKKLEGSAEQAVRALVQSKLGHFGVRRAELRFERRVKLNKGQVLKFQQVHEGLPVLGRGISALVREGYLVVVSGKLASIQSLPKGARVNRARAERALKARFPSAKISSARLAVRPQAPARVVWQLRASTLAPPNSWRVLVDALSGELIVALSMRVEAEGWAYLPNPTTGELTQVPLERLKDENVLDGAYANVQRCGAAGMDMECDRQASPLRNESYLWALPDEPSISDAFAEVHTYYHVDAFHHWLKERFGFERAGERQHLDVYVNFHWRDEDGETYGMPNAFFGDVTGDGHGELVFGQARRDFAYDGDVVYHEFTHSAVDETSSLEPELDELGFNNMPLALNEAFADLMSSAFTGDGSVGEYAGGSYGGMSIRDLTGELMRCPDDLIGESHHDGLIFGRLAWAVREEAPSKRAFDEVLYTTMVALHSTADIDDALSVLTASARSISPGTEAVVEKVMARAGLSEGCPRLVPITPDKTWRGFMFGAAMAPGLGYIPAGMQYRVDVPADATKLTIKLRTLGRHSETAPVHKMGAFVRRGQSVAFNGKETLRDITMTSKDPTLELTLDAGENQLVAGSSYFILPLNIAMDDIGYEVEIALDRAPPMDAAPVEPDAGVAATDQGPAPDAGSSSSDDGGCAVGATGTGSGSGLVLLCLALLALRRRRGAN